MCTLAPINYIGADQIEVQVDGHFQKDLEFNYLRFVLRGDHIDFD